MTNDFTCEREDVLVESCNVYRQTRTSSCKGFVPRYTAGTQGVEVQDVPRLAAFLYHFAELGKRYLSPIRKALYGSKRLQSVPRQIGESPAVHSPILTCYNPLRVSSLDLQIIDYRTYKQCAKQSLYLGSLAFFFVLIYLLQVHSGFAIASIDLNVIASIESSGRSSAVGDGGRSIGLYQLSDAVVKEYNSAHKTRFTHKDALNPKTAKLIASWYFEVRIPQIIRWLKLPVDNRSKIICFNAGCAALKKKAPLPPITQAYLRKYQAMGGSL